MNTVDWEAKYQVGDTPWDKGAPSPGLVDFLQHHPTLPRARVVVPGCGLGHDARALAESGHDATGIDIAPSAVGAARRRHAGIPRLRFEVGDFLGAPRPQRFDVLFEHTCFCAIPVPARAAYVAATRRWIRPGGFLVAVHYFLPPEDPEGPPFGTSRPEILERFGTAFQLLAEWIPRSYPNRTGLERMYWWRRRP